jgi:hypothetical protein
VLSKFDFRGSEVEVTYTDEMGQPVRHRDGFSKCVRTYDPWGVVTEKAFSGFDKGDGVFEAHTKYDQRGNEIEQWYLDEAGQRVRSKDGHLSRTKTYDERGNLIEDVYWGYAGPGGLSKIVVAYDQGAHTITETRLDSANRLTASPDGYSRRIRKYDANDNRLEVQQDERGNVTRVMCFDSEGHPAPHREGWTKWKADYDAHGRIGESYFGPNDEPLTLADGYAAWRIQRDELGREKELEFLSPAGQRVNCQDGYAVRTLQYDANGNPLEVAFLDDTGRRVRIKEGYAGQAAAYDAHGRRVEVRYLDEAGQPATDARGVTRWVASYDDMGVRIATTCYDAAGNTIVPEQANA